LEKEAKLAAKVSKAIPTGEKSTKAEKEKKIEQPEFVNNTPKGEKKG
jgi:valyl-tRNA synthetase